MKDLPGPTIEPDPDGGYKPAPRVWVAAWIILVLLWAGYLYSFTVDWKSVMIGAATAMIASLWAVDITGNKTPDALRRPRRPDPPEWPPR